MRTFFNAVRFVALVGLLAGSIMAFAKPPAPLPALAGGQSTIQLRIIRYTGGVNGEMVVEVQNTGSKTETFNAQGLYFVPEGDPDKAPQRLGAAGPFVLEGKNEKPLDQLPLAPRAKAQVRLQVFCIDSHRSSPSASHSFRTGKDRLPRELRSEIDGKAKAALRQHGGKMPAAKEAIQSEVWGARNKKWIQLDGERKNEKNANEQRMAPNSRVHRYPSRIQEQRRQPAPAPQPSPAPPQQQRSE